MTTAKRVQRYVKGTIGHGFVYSSKECYLHGYYDSDHAGDVDDRNSTL